MACTLDTRRNNILHEIHQVPSSPITASKVQDRLVETRSQVFSKTLYHSKTVWLFVRSDLFTAGIPAVAFGVSNAVAAHTYGIQSSGSIQLQGLMLACLWFFMHILVYNISNQSQPNAIVEDLKNKPWRPVAAGRLSAEQGRLLAAILYPIDLGISTRIGGLPQSLALIILGYVYSNLRGGEVGIIARNIINVGGILCVAAGCLEVLMAQPGLLVSAGYPLWSWIGIVGAIIFTTVHVQDLRDVPGDRLIGKRTVPVVFGDSIGRWTSAIPIAFWSVVCPLYWSLSMSSILFVAYGFYVAFRTLTKKTIRDDKKTYHFWCLWLMFVYFLPALKVLEDKLLH